MKMLKQNVMDTSPSALAGFRREAAILQNLRHPNVISFFAAQLDAQPVRYLAIYCSPGPVCRHKVFAYCICLC